MHVIDFIVTHHDEPWSVGKPFFDMLAMQRNIDFADIRVILVQDGENNACTWGPVLNDYPFQVKIITINHSGPAAARNAGLRHAGAEWVMFCDFDDMFADVAALRGILQVLPTDDADVIWMRTYREERVRATNRDINGTFINCLDEHFQSTDGKLYRRQSLVENNILFRNDLAYEYESAFNHIVLTTIPSHRVMKLTVDFIPYMKTLRDDSYTMDPGTVSGRVASIYQRDVYLTRLYATRGAKEAYTDMVAETIFDMYYILNSKPTVKNADELELSFAYFYEEFKSVYESASPTNLEVILDNCINKMLSVVQDLYNYNGIETEPPYDGMENVNQWLETVKVPPREQQADTQNPQHDKPVPKSQTYDGPRIVIYSGTYNTYQNMLTSAKSLLSHTKVDKIYFLTEDNEFPYPLPDIIQNINVKNQKYFPKNGPNFGNVWSYMCMMRAAYPNMFLKYARALSLDIDIIVNEDIGDLWDLDLTDYYFAGVPEPGRQKTSQDPVYCNFGVIMMNLNKMRADGIGWKAIDLLNTSRLGCPEQDALNKVCAHHILPLPPDYNYTPFSHITGEPQREIITHYAGLKYWKHFRPVREYANKSWEEILGKENDKNGTQEE